MKNIILIFLLGLGFVTMSCAQNTTENTDPKELSNLKSGRVDQSTFKAYLNENPEVVLVDVRTPGEYSGGKIENAINIDFNGSDFQNEISKLDKTKPVMIYCQAGGRSAKALSMMQKMGFEFVLELEGGYGNWKK